MNISFYLKGIARNLVKRFSLVLWVALGLIILAEAWVIKGSLDKVLTAADETPLGNTQLVRVNFESYERIEKKLNFNQQYLPPEPETADPFGLPPE